MFAHKKNKTLRIALLFPLLTPFFSCQETNQFAFLNDLPIKELPYTESTDFTQRNELKPTLNKSQVDMLGLRKLFTKRELIYSDPYLAFADSVCMRYRVNLSTNFETVVLSCYDWRIYTLLINYKNDFEVIDFEVLAFDFVDERSFRIFSVIKKDKLEITQTSGAEDSSTTIYTIEPDGTINASG